MNPIGDACPKVCAECAFTEYNVITEELRDGNDVILSAIGSALDAIGDGSLHIDSMCICSVNGDS